MIKISDVDYDIQEDPSEGKLLIKQFQDINQEFIDDCRETYEASRTERARDYHKVASVPTVIADKWKQEGFDVFREPARAIVARLQNENLDYFVTTAKRV